MNQSGCEPDLPACTPGMFELSFGKINPNGMSTGVNKGDGPLRGSATQFQNIESLDLTQNVQICFSDSPNAPGHRLVGKKVVMLVLIFVAIAVPRCAILFLRQTHGLLDGEFLKTMSASF